MRSNVRLFKVKGIPVGLNWTWLFVFVLVFWSFATALFPTSYPNLPGSTYLLMALVGTVLFFGSILAHELSHTVQALRQGVRMGEITLWLFGGISRAEQPLPSPAAELRVVAAGPLASAALAVAFLALAAVARGVGLPKAAWGVLGYLAWVNGVLLAFNLVPALPLDGGRILHAVLWRRMGDRAEATISAARAGRAFGFVLVAIGLLSLLTVGGLGGVWFVFLGWFLLQAVNEEVLSARLQRAVEGLRVSDVMSRDPVTVPPHVTIDGFAELAAGSQSHRAYPVVEGGRLVGLLPLRRAAAVQNGERGEIHVADVMLTRPEVPVARPDEPAVAALDMLGPEPGRIVVVVGDAGERVVGLLTPADIAHRLTLEPLHDDRTPRQRSNAGIFAMVGVLIAVAGAVLYHPPFVVVSPGASFDVRGDITLTGVRAQRPTGPYLATSVRLSQPSALGLLVAALRSDREVLRAGDVVPTGVSPGQIDRYERQLFTDSQQMAAAAAAAAAGYDAALTGSGAEVVGLIPSSSAASVLKVGDVITAVDGVTVPTVTQLHDAIAGRPAGDQLTLTVQRQGRTVPLSIRSARLPDVTGGTGIGVVAETHELHLVLPFDITFVPRPDIGGPSAGLAYALAITDMLDSPDDAHGHTVAATGTVAADGSVGPVGGVHEKAIAAHHAGAQVFVVPSAEVASVRENGLAVRGVGTLNDALQVLRAASQS